jgi:TatA/E family protein of Tat protein translocase
MFSLGAPELLVILVIVLLLFGGKRLPEIGRAFGKSVREFKKASDTDKDEISSWVSTGEREETSSPETTTKEEKKGVLENEVEKLPGVKEAKEIKETASKIKAASRFFLKK